jgi:mono/diheme cytochrome c family protein
MALHPDTGLVYLPVQEGQTRFTQEANFVHRGIGAFNTGLIREHKTFGSYLTAWDPKAQKAAWKVPVGGGGVLATKGGLIFQGTGDSVGELVAYRADNGQRVWSSHTPNAIQAPPVTYVVNGEQYILVAGGAGGGGPGGAGTQSTVRQVGRLYAFKLNGKGSFPADPAPAPPPNPAPDAFSAAQVAQGGDRYGIYCVRCHGPNASTNNVIPDLRRSPFLQSGAAWNSVVMKGALERNGMIGWSEFIKDDEAEAIRAFVSAKATELKNAPPPGPPSRTGTGRQAEQ